METKSNVGSYPCERPVSCGASAGDHGGRALSWFLEGPFFSEAQVTEFLGRDDWSLIRRFALVPGDEGKLRPIDDCLEAQLNFAYKLATDADESASELLDLLGWRHARTGPKGKPFESSFNVLGCSLRLDRLVAGEVVLENKQGRLEHIFAQLDQIRAAKRMTLHQAQVIHGLLRYSCGFFAGKHMQQVCAELLQLGKSITLQSRGRLEEFCQYAANCLQSCKPRRIKSGGDLRPILIFTDASWESQVRGLGAVVIDTAGGRVSIYSDSLKHHWIKEIGDHLICQLELYVMVSLRWSRNFFHDRRTIWWVDNEAARFFLMKDISACGHYFLSRQPNKAC